MLVKAENLLRVLAELPALTAIDTLNGAANERIIAINRTLGFRPVDAVVQWQQRLT